MNGIEGGVELVTMSGKLITPHHKLFIYSRHISIVVTMSGKGKKCPQLKDYDWLFQRYSIERKSSCEISRILKSSRSAVLVALHHVGIQMRSYAEAAHYQKLKYNQLDNKSWLQRKHWEEELSLSQIAKIIGCKRNSVFCAMERLGILVRTKSEAASIWQQGEKNPNWNGGISYFPYCTKFNNALKEEIRDKFGRKCFICPKTEEEEERKLSVHHVDYNKEQGCNGVRWLLVPLCRSCNTKVNNNREYWQDLIIEKLKREGYYMILLKPSWYSGFTR